MGDSVLRVLHVVTYMGRGGLETMLMNYYRHIDRSKVQFDFLVHRDFKSDYDDEITSLGGKIYRISRLIPWSKSYKKTLNKFLTSHSEYVIIHVHQDCLSSVALKEAQKACIPIRIAHCHTANQDKNLEYPIKIFYKQFIPKYATDLFSCGISAGKWMFQSNSFTVVNNAIDAKKFIYNTEKRNAVRISLGLCDELVIGHIGRFTSAKNHMFLIDVFAELHKQLPSAKLLLVGDGELKDKIEEKIHLLSLSDSVIITGVRTDIPDLLQAMDVFVMPSNYEGLGIAAIEAQASGLPCILSEGVPEECIKTDLVTRLSLKDSINCWTEAVLSTKNIKRKDRYSEIANAKYDIKENAKWLENFYLSRRKQTKIFEK